MDLFIVEDLVVYPSDEAMLIPDFAELARRNLQELAYVYFMVSPKKSNPFSLYDKAEKHRALCESVLKDSSYRPDELVKKCLYIYTEFIAKMAPSLILYDSAMKAIHKTKEYFTDLDYREKDKSGKMIHNPKFVLGTITEIEATSRSLEQLRERVNREIEDSKKKKEYLPTEDPAYLEQILTQYEQSEQETDYLGEDQGITHYDADFSEQGTDDHSPGTEETQKPSSGRKKKEDQTDEEEGGAWFAFDDN